MIRRIVEGMTTEVNECADGSEALTAYSRFPPDWVLMDIKMAEIDGITATKQLKESFPAAKILIVTDYDDDDLRKSAREAGAAGYIIKEDLLALRQILAAA